MGHPLRCFWVRPRIFAVIGAATLYTASTIYAQDDRVLADSLIILLPHLPADSEKVYVYRDIAYYLKEVAPDLALVHAKRGEAIAKGLGLTVGRIDNLFQQAFIWEEKERHDSSMACLKGALELAQVVDDRSREGKVLLAIGSSHYFQGQLSDAIAHYDQALDVYEQVDDPSAQAYALNNLGVIYRLRRDHAKAIGIYERSLALKRAQGDAQGMANTLHNLGLAHAYGGDAERALPYFTEARSLYHELGDTLELRRTDMAEGVALHALGRFAEARPLLERGLELPERYVVERASVLLHLGEEDMAEGLSERGLQRLSDAHAVVSGTGRLDLQRQVEKALAQAHDQLGNAALSAPHWKAYAQLSDTLANEQRQWAIEEMQARFESREKDLTIRSQEEALQQEATQRQLNFAIAVLLGALLLLAALYARSRVHLNLRLRRAVDEREWLLREMHHRVKNNLQMLNSLLSIQSRTLADPGARTALRESRARVQAIGLIHQFLYGRDAFRNIRMRDYMERLLQQIAQAADADIPQVAMTHEVEDISLDVDLATPIGLIVNELVTNALKHAFPDGRRGEVRVVLKRMAHAVTLQVTDNGVGGGKADSDTSGFGYILLRTLAQRMQAEMQVEQTNGTRVKFIIPLSSHGKEPADTGGGG